MFYHVFCLAFSWIWGLVSVIDLGKVSAFAVFNNFLFLYSYFSYLITNMLHFSELSYCSYICMYICFLFHFYLIFTFKIAVFPLADFLGSVLSSGWIHLQLRSHAVGFSIPFRLFLSGFCFIVCIKNFTFIMVGNLSQNVKCRNSHLSQLLLSWQHCISFF